MQVIQALGIIGITSAYISFIYIFMAAYMNGGSIMVHINRYSEANVELILNLILLPFVSMFIYKLAKGDNIFPLPKGRGI